MTIQKTDFSFLDSISKNLTELASTTLRFRELAVITGTAEPDTLDGTAENDTINGGDGTTPSMALPAMTACWAKAVPTRSRGIPAMTF